MEEEAKHHHETHSTHSPEESVKIPVKLLISIAVIVAVLVLGFFVVKAGIFTGSNVSEKEATSKLLTWFAVNAPESEVTFVSVSKQGSFYEIVLSIDGQETPVPVTIDGKYIVPDRIPLD